jgi:hypothetical protein
MREWIKNLLSASDSVSSKRLGFFFTLCLIAYAVIRYTTPDNIKVVLAELILLAFGLIGLVVFEKVKLK